MTLDEMENVLESLGIEPISTYNNEIRAQCPGHLDRTGKEDRNPSWFINAETGAHICFSCHFKGSLPFLIGYINKYFCADGSVDLEKSKEWITVQVPLSISFEKAVNKSAPLPESFIDSSMLSAFVTPPAYALKSRGLSRSAAEECNLLWDEQAEAWIIPVYSGYTGELLGWQQKSYRGRFFKNHPMGMKKSNSLYGYQKGNDTPVVLVESPLDAVRLRSLGIYGVASYGSYISKSQLNLLKASSRLIVAMDNDDAGRDSNKRIISLLPEMWLDAWFFDYSHTDQKDVGGMSRDEILSGIENVRHFVSIA